MEIVFASYGITADKYNYDDYKGIDVNGKVVLLQLGIPSMDDESISETDKIKFSKRSYKFDNAKIHGAAEVLVILGG